MSIALGIEIGGTKIQVGAGLDNTRPKGLARTQIQPGQNAEAIRNLLPALIEEALQNGNFSQNDIGAIGVGFGGPVDSKRGHVITSHQVEGWDDFPLQAFFAEQYNVPVAIQNDASIAGLAEATLGAGKGHRRVFYITIGSGIGGGIITNGEIDEGQGLGAGEIGHTWVPDPDTGEPDKLEHICSGWSIAERAREAILNGESSDIKKMCPNLDELDAKTVYAAAEKDDLLASTLLDETCNTLAVAICNIIALLHPEKIILGGGVSLMGDLFWEPLQQAVHQNAFAPFANSFEVVPAALGEDVVVVGAILLGEKHIQ